MPPSFMRTHLPVIRFVLTTVLLMVVLYVVLKVPWVERHFVAPYTQFVAVCSRICLGLIGVETSGSGGLIVSPEFSVTIKNVCNGLEVMAIFFATTIGFPSTIKGKLFGLLLGFPVIFLINTVRVVVLFILGSRNPQVFDDVHFYYAQALVIIATVAVWLLWVTTLSNYGSKTRPRLFG
jgi:exosortase H (IPTLxxWG-CTERM-specific)